MIESAVSWENLSIRGGERSVGVGYGVSVWAGRECKRKEEETLTNLK